VATLATLRRSVQQKIGLDTTSSGTEETLVDAWINEGIVDVLLRTRCHVNCADLTLAANTWKYNLSDSILAINDVSCTSATTGESRVLTRTTPERILSMRQGSPSTSPLVTYYALNGSDLLMIYPTPSSADTLEVYYVPRPSAMSGTANDPSAETYGKIPTEYHKAIEYYALWQAADYDDDSSSQTGEYYRVLYEQYLVRIKRQAERRGGRYMGAATIGRRRPLVHDHSQYPQ
jgi:hypothetical protein